ncbi:MAG: cupin domain-containing protein [Acidimicrobiia bacterium]|nr:cupin domain-containing protein [Acidimicrobiia bacterium]
MDLRTKAWRLIVALVACGVVITVILLLVGTGSGEEHAASKKAPRPAQPAKPAPVPAPGSGVTRAPFGEAAPANAPGQRLYLQQVTIAPHAKLAEHFHQGTQLARVMSGTLTYNIVSGTAAVTRADGKAEDATGPTTVFLQPGDSLVETASLIHYGANDTDAPVVIELAALLEQGAPLATPVGTGTTGTVLHLATALASQSRTLLNAGPKGSITYGWNRLTGNANLDGKPVAVEMLGNVNYTAGNGPFFGFITFTFNDKSTLAVSMQGLATQAPDGSSTVAATLGIFGGTGRYENAAGTGTFTGSRSAGVGAAVDSTFDLTVSNGP